jgi:chemotaxis protein methyltransferase CheR
MIDNPTFRKIQKFIYNEVGINLTDSKRALVSSRVGKRMRQLDIDHYRDYLDFVERDNSGEELIQFLNAISTNVTHFFREKDHFVRLSEIFQEALNTGTGRFRVWSAACSSGEEPYSIAITLRELLGKKEFDLKILATDISTKVLRHSLEGIYSEKQMKTVDRQHRETYFEKMVSKPENQYKVKNFIREMVLFKRLNLSKVPFPLKGNLDVIFCRNVMIYFDDTVRSRLVQEFYRLLRPGGYLFVGHSESLASIENKFTLQKASVYKKKV